MILIENLRPKWGLLEKITYAFALSTTISIISFLIFGLFFKLSEVKFIIPMLLLITTYRVNRSNTPKINRMEKERLVPILIISILIRIALLLKIHTIIGHDVGRFSIISHALILKDRITLDLRPYDDAQGFFYFPGAFIVPAILESIGFDPIFGVSVFLLLTSILGILAFYFLIVRMFDEKLASTATFFYAFLFDPILHLGVFGIFPNAIGIFFATLSLSAIYEILNKKSRDLWLYSLIFFGIYAFHLYAIFLPFIFLLALISEKILSDDLKAIKGALPEFFRIFFTVFLLSAPHLLLSKDYLLISLRQDNIADLMMFAYERINLSPLEKVVYSIASTPLGGIISPISIAGFLFFILASPTLYRRRPSLLFFFTYAFILSLLVISEFNLVRNVVLLWFIYPVAFSIFLKDWKVNFLILLLFFWIESQSPLFLLWYLRDDGPEGVPWVVSPSFFEVMEFIKSNVSEDAKFLIDGGGAGCTGASPSYGERIFPLTSRKIFFFTNYCWADYDKKKYEHRVEIYRMISINPDDENAFLQLKKHGVTHIYIGKKHVALKPELFLRSQKYELIYQKDGEYVFQVK